MSRVLREGWEVRKLGEVLQKTETTDPTKKPNEKFVYLDVSSVNKESKEIENVVVLLGKDAPSRARKLVRTNDVIFATVRPTHSRVALITKKYNEQVCSTGYFVLRGKEFIYNQYLYYFLLTDEFNRQMEKLQKGASYPAVTDTEVKNILLRYPPLPEQQKIVAILDEAFGAIEKAKTNAKHNLTHAKELFESYLQSVFEDKGEGREEKRLGDVCEYDKAPNKRDDLLYVGLEDIQSNTGIFIGLLEPKSVKSSTFYFNDQHVLYGRLRPYLNKVLLPDFEGHCSTEIFPIKSKKNILDRGFLFKWLIATETMKKINETWTGATLPRANMNAVLEFKINIPPITEQQTIVKKLDTLSEQTKTLEKIYQQKINDLDELKKSILQKAFNGELV